MLIARGFSGCVLACGYVCFTDGDSDGTGEIAGDDDSGDDDGDDWD